MSGRPLQAALQLPMSASMHGCGLRKCGPRGRRLVAGLPLQVVPACLLHREDELHREDMANA